jgi:hypothetical protein
MITRTQQGYVKTVLFLNGVVDILAAFLLIGFPAAGLPIPGYPELHYHTAYAAGGWGIATLTLGIARMWASRKPEYRWFMAFLGLFEAVTLSLYSVGRIAFSPTTLLQGAISLAVGAVFAIAYGLGFAFRARSR